MTFAPSLSSTLTDQWSVGPLDEERKSKLETDQTSKSEWEGPDKTTTTAQGLLVSLSFGDAGSRKEGSEK